MKTFRAVLFSALLFLFAVCPLFGQKLYLLPVGDTSESSGLESTVKLDLKRIRGVFSDNIADFRLVIYGSDDWEGPRLNDSSSMRQDILQAIENCPAGSNDTIVFYWSGHGGYDEDGHYFVMPRGSSFRYLYRNEVMSALKSHGARLTVLISDCCNTFSRTFFAPALAPNPPLQNTVSPLFRKLFFEAYGILDVTSSQRGETSRCNSETGSYFTLGLWLLLNQSNANDTDWSSLLQDVDHLVKKINDGQTVFIKSLPRYNGNSDDNEESETTWSRQFYQPENGDRVVRVNGKSIGNESEFRAAVKNSPSTIYLDIVDHRTGRKYRMRTNLWSRQYVTRLGLYIETDYRGGVQITGVMPNSPAARCQIPE